MTNLLIFPRDRKGRSRALDVSACGEVVIFPGDRIERRDVPHEAMPAKPKRRRWSRQQNVKLRGD
jgi:hypothetical protein